MDTQFHIAKKAALLPSLTLTRQSLLQRAAISATPAHRVPSIVHDVLRSPGQSLDSGTRAFIEPRFNHDFSGVRVHTDARAAESARSVNALAYTVGHDVVFGAGKYAPTTTAGKRLLAHELTHVVQQCGRSQSGRNHLTINSPGETTEREAHNAAQFVTEGNQFGAVSQETSLRIQRLPAGEEDPIHRPIINQYRKEHGLPASGVDEFGNRVGPSDAQIKYGMLGGKPNQQVQIQVPAPPNQQLSAEQVQQITKQPLPQKASGNETQPTQKTGGTQPGQAAQQAPASPPAQTHRVFEPLSPEPAKFGGDVSLDSSANFQLSFVARHVDAKRFSLFGKVPIDILHEPTMTMSASFSPLSFGTLGAQLSATLLNVHFQRHGTDFIELGLAQLGLGFDSNNNVIGTVGAQAEIHSPNPHFSIFINTGGTLKYSKDKKWNADWTPISFGILVHWANP